MVGRRNTGRGIWVLCLLAVLATGAIRPAEVAAQDASPPSVVHGRPAIPPANELAKLPADGGPRWNRLVFEHSPYLLQHAANPVDWWPWSEAAFAQARRRDVPVFVSIGYATCHWCHVMERESFEDAEVAALLNAAFVCVKVDREERPDLDAAYMVVTQAMTGSGGWPMTVVMTADKKPFFAGTYFPKSGSAGRPGMLELIPAVKRAWSENRAGVADTADRIVAAVQSRPAAGAGGDTLGEAALTAAYSQLASQYDSTHGGFGRQPKFPVPHNLRFLLRYHRRTGEAKALEMAETTLREMRAGGIWDHLGFGFHRYSTDQRWLVPHFEKMLYDQALLAMAYTEAWQATGREEYRQTAEEILAYVTRDMTSPGGGFYSAEDADSEGEEGLFYLWTAAQITDVLGREDGALWVDVYGVKSGGNFRDQASGKVSPRNILHRRENLVASAKRLSIRENALGQRLEAMRAKLLAARSKRTRPLVDDKVLTDWNGLMISAYARAAQAFGQPGYAVAAARAADFVLAELRGADGRLRKRWRDGHAGHLATLEDYAFFIGGLLDLYEATFEPARLEQAVALARQMETHFAAPGGGYFLAPDDGEKLFVRPREVYDGAIPSGNSVAALDLLRLARMTGDTRFENRARRLLDGFAAEVGRAPSAHSQLMLAVDLAVGPSNEVVIAGDATAADTKGMLAALRRPFLPNKVVLLRPPGEAPAITRLAPYTETQTALDGRATAYVCRGFACSLPTTDPTKMLDLMQPAKR